MSRSYPRPGQSRGKVTLSAHFAAVPRLGELAVEESNDSTARSSTLPRVRLLAALAAALVLAAPAAAGLPRHGLVVPGKSLGGVRLGTPINALLDRWGRSFGICRGCATPTWYFNYVPFEAQGAAASFAGTRVSALFTLWSPKGWRTPQGLEIGDPAARVTSLYGKLARQDCRGYYGLLLHRKRTTTAFYVVDDRVWGFGLSRGGSPPCR
jgi:hypothetical protein